MRTIITAVLCLGVASGCSGLYSGKPEKVKRPKTEKMPEEAPVATAEIKWITECKAAFQEEPAGQIAKHKKNEGRVRPQIDQGVALLEQASDPSTSDDQKAGNVKQAINVLRRVLDDAPYSPRATYNLAVAYARARRKGCSTALLKRLAALEKYPDFQAEAKRMIDTAQEDSTLKLFEKEMLEALGK
jgi:Flp pilus assembly protein TadD